MHTTSRILVTGLMLASCASAAEMPWVELTPRDPGSGPTFEMSGTVHHLDLEGGLYVLRDAAGTQYNPLNLPPEFQVDGLAIEVQARRREDVMTIGMAGAIIELTRIRRAPGEQSTAPTGDEATLRHFKTVLWPQAYRTQDVELLDGLLHDSFQMIDAEGKRSTKQQELQHVADEAWDPGTFEYRIERLQIYDGRFAIVSGTGIAAKYSYRSSNALIKEDGRWQAVASHVSGVEER